LLESGPPEPIFDNNTHEATEVASPIDRLNLSTIHTRSKLAWWLSLKGLRPLWLLSSLPVCTAHTQRCHPSWSAQTFPS